MARRRSCRRLRSHPLAPLPLAPVNPSLLSAGSRPKPRSPTWTRRSLARSCSAAPRTRRWLGTTTGRMTMTGRAPYA
jgi:hypothetical protein